MSDTWTEDILKQLQIRDAFEKKDSSYFKAFAQLSERIRDNESPPPSLSVEIGTNTSILQENQRLRKDNEQLIVSLNDSSIELQTMREQSQAQQRTIASLEKTVDKLNKRLNNITQELKEKNKSIEIINDELLMNQIQVNVLNDKVGTLSRENEGLITRWMEKVRSDADKMNDANEFLKSVGGSKQ